MDMRLALAFLLASWTICGTAASQTALSPENEKNLRDSLANCVKLVKSAVPPKSIVGLYGTNSKLYYEDFDAYYTNCLNECLVLWGFPRRG